MKNSKTRIAAFIFAVTALTLGACSSGDEVDPLDALRTPDTNTQPAGNTSEEPTEAATEVVTEEPASELEDIVVDEEGNLVSGDVRHGTWADFDGSKVAHPEGADDLWGAERVSQAPNHVLDAIHEASANGNALTGDTIEARDFVVMEPYLTPEAYALIATELESGDQHGYVVGIAPYVTADAQFRDENGNAAFTIATDEPATFTMTSEPWMEVAVDAERFGDDEARLTVYVGYDITYYGEGKSGTEHRLAEYSLLPMGDGWGIDHLYFQRTGVTVND